MDSQKPQSRAGFKKKLLNALMAGAGSLVLASAVITAPPAGTARSVSTTMVLKRADEVRAQLTQEMQAPGKAQDPSPQLAWWRNWGNWGWHPWWPNWHNWRNWGNW